jgi:hypothetical protein
MKDKKAMMEAGLLAACFLLIYTLTRSGTLSPADDAITLVTRIDSGVWFHPHHLVYNWVAGKWLHLARDLGLGADTAGTVEEMNAFFGALTLGVTHLLLRVRGRLDTIGALLGTTLVGFSFGFWFFSTMVEVYIPALFFLTLAMLILTAPTLSGTGFAALGLVHAMAILFHQVHVLFFSVIACRLLLEGFEEKRRLFKKAGLYAVAVGFGVGIPYLLIGWSLPSVVSLPTYWYWLTEYAHSEQFWHPIAISTLLKAIVGFGSCILGGHFAFAIPGFPALLDKVLQANWLTDDAFVARNLGAVWSWTLLCCSALLVGLILFGLFRKAGPPADPRGRYTSRLIPCLTVWLLTYVTFFFFWEPMNNEFWIPQSLVLWTLFTIFCMRHPPLFPALIFRARPLLALIAGLLLLINFQGSIRWLIDPRNDYYAMKAIALSGWATEEDLIVIMHPWMDRAYLQRVTRAKIMEIVTRFEGEKDRDAALAAIQRRIDETLSSGHKVWIAGDAINLTPLVLRLYGQPLSRFVEDLWGGYTPHWETLNEGVIAVYVLGGN